MNYVTPNKPQVPSSPNKRQRVSLTRVSKASDTKEPTVKLLKPKDGSMYSKLEALEIIDLCQENSSIRHHVIDEMIRLNYIPVKKTAIYSWIKKRDDGQLVLNAWNGVGRPPPFLNDDSISDIAKSLQQTSGRSFGRQEISKLLAEHQKKQIVEANHVPLTVPDSLSKSTVNNYMAHLALHPDISIVTNTQRKTDTRHAAENSFRAPVALLMTSASTHFVEVSKENEDVRRAMKDAPESTRLFYDLVTKARRGPVLPVKPQLIFSTDEQTEFVYVGSKTKPDEFRLVSKKSHQDRGTKSIYNLDNGKDMTGIRVKLTWTFNAIGRCAPLYIIDTFNNIFFYVID
jgi:hypothetical protein